MGALSKFLILICSSALTFAPVLPGAIMRTIPAAGGGGTIGPVSVAANGDDGEIWTTFFWSDGEDADGIGKMYLAASSPVYCFYRFILPSGISSGATITAATIEIWGEGNLSWENGVSDLEIKATDSGDAPAPTEGGHRLTEDGGSTAQCAAEVAWNNVTWTTDAFNTSPSITTIIQELVNDNGGFSAGEAIVIWVNGTTGAQAHGQLMEFAGEANTARLTITWTP